MINYSQNHRRVEVGRQLWRSSYPASLKQGTCPGVFQIVSEDGDSITFLDNLCQYSGILRVKRWFLMFRGNLLCVFQFAPIASAPTTWASPGSVLFAPSIQILVCIEEIFPEPSFVQTKQPQLSQPFLMSAPVP